MTSMMILRLTPTRTNEQKKKKNHRSVHNNNNYVPDAFIIQEKWSSQARQQTHTHIDTENEERVMRRMKMKRMIRGVLVVALLRVKILLPIREAEEE